MARLVVSVTVTSRWWLLPYINTLAFFCNVTGLEPDWQKFAKTVMRGTKVTIGGRTVKVDIP